jgi:hypothetical protein
MTHDSRGTSMISCGSHTTWTVPDQSRSPMNATRLWSRLNVIHPASRTFVPSSRSRSSLTICVRNGLFAIFPA